MPESRRSRASRCCRPRPRVTVPTHPAPAKLAFGVVAFASPAGYESVSAAPVIAVEFGFVMAIVSVEPAPGAALAGVKVFVTVGAWSTLRVAVAATAEPAFVVVTGPVVLR